MNILKLHWRKKKHFLFFHAKYAEYANLVDHQKFVPEILHLLRKTELKLYMPLPRKLQKTLSVNKQSDKQFSTFKEKRGRLETSYFL